jgi:hypothetical protein
MIKNKSRQTSSVLEQKVLLDITEKGWIGILTPSETSYDIIVDMGVVDGKREFVTIQVKTSLRTTSRSGGANEPVSKNGKNRNSYSYYDEDVTYLASLNKFGEVEYIHKDDYKYMTTSQLSRANRSAFPTNEKMIKYRTLEIVNDKFEPLKEHYA